MFSYRSLDCFRLGWPWRLNSDFFSKPIPKSKVILCLCPVLWSTWLLHLFVAKFYVSFVLFVLYQIKCIPLFSFSFVPFLFVPYLLWLNTVIVHNLSPELFGEENSCVHMV